MYDYHNLKNKDNQISNNLFFSKWTKLPPDSLGLADIIWLTDEGSTLIKDIEVSPMGYMAKNKYYHFQQNIHINTENLSKFILKKGCDYYSIKTGDSIVYLLRIDKNLLMEEENNINLLMFNLYDFLYKNSIIPNTNNTEERFKLYNIKKRIDPHQKLYFQNYQFYEKLIEKIPEIPINWVWFRRNNKKLTTEISERALSWIQINPKSDFHLWTNLQDHSEYLEFIEDLNEEIKEIFRVKIKVHYKSEIISIFNEFISEYQKSDDYDEVSFNLLNDEFKSEIKHSMIFKTDILRLIILYKFGGVYADFNDCLCLSPIKYIFLSHDINEPLGVTDESDLNHASNYFLYTPKDNNRWKCITYEMIKLSKNIIAFLKNNEMKNLIKDVCFKMISKMENNNFKLDHESNFDSESYELLNQKYEEKFSQIPYLGKTPRPISLYYWKILIYNIIMDLVNQESKDTINNILHSIKNSKNTRRNSKNNRRNSKNTVDTFLGKIYIDYEGIDEKFENSYAFWWTDYSLNTIMHFTNFPIFCRMMNYDLYLLPFGYYMRYGCLLSYVCHLGDGGSYGYEKHNSISAKFLYN